VRIRPVPSHAASLLELTKPRITVFVVMTAFVGFAAGLSGPLASLDPVLLLHTLLGTALVASGTSAFNQLWERDLDARMERTSRRPLPSGRVGATEAFVFAFLLSAAGVLELAFFVNPLTALLAAFTLASYVGAYTPMKTLSPLSTIVGAVPGALPPLGGFTASYGAIAAPGLALFALLFLWQMPHFFAIGWRHREDYAKAGVKILATVDPSGIRSGRQALLYTVSLLPVVLLPSWLKTAGPVYAAGALLLTIFFVWASYQFARKTTDATAKTLFLASIAWLPAILILFVADRIV
jgi:protoheme IX farnesyltransferase